MAELGGPAFRVAGRRQDVPTKANASRIEDWPCGIHTSATRSRLPPVGGWPRLEQACFFLGGSGCLPPALLHRVVAQIADFAMWAHSRVVTELVDCLAAHGAMRVLGEECLPGTLFFRCTTGSVWQALHASSDTNPSEMQVYLKIFLPCISNQLFHSLTFLKSQAGKLSSLFQSTSEAALASGMFIDLAMGTSICTKLQ